ncbi:MULTISPECIES: transglutaminase domain-containing protein [unclassified Winogradskyella]|uniref:transglutaminase domain-containing protein n=1 Tax=unclassified Winogradskyella TaxID=2615021 RepID=UPI000B3D16D7|nr:MULTISPECIES: transglutaminase domain-containing protein [unclassified Winogradskyella]
MKKILLLCLIVHSLSIAQVSDFKSIDFTKADNIAKLNKGASLKNMGKLVHNLTYKLPTEIEKFRAIHTWVCENIKGDYSQTSKALRKKRRFKDNPETYLVWNKRYRKKAYKKLLRYKRTMCTGYAYIVKELCFLAGIEAKIIDGYARTFDANIDALEFQNHSWNAIKINNKWYLCDTTWSSGYMNENSVFIKDYNDGYFLADPLLFSKNHYPIEKKWLLVDTLTNSDFVPGPIVYGEAFKYNATPIFPIEMEVKTAKGNAVNFSVKSEDVASEKVSLLHTFRNGEKKLDITDVSNEKGLIKFKHRFKRRGYYDIHLKIEDDIIATYTINVTN